MVYEEKREDLGQKEEFEDVLELVDIIEENSEEVSDIFVNKREESTDDFSLESNGETTGEVSEKEELVSAEDEFADTEPLISETLKEDLSENREDNSITEEEFDIFANKQEESTDDFGLESNGEAIGEVSEKEEDLEEIKIPIDEETKLLAEEIDNEEKQEQENSESNEDAFEKTEKTIDTEGIDVSVVEKRLLEASEKIIEAIQDATVEIALSIAKVAPKIVEEVAREIIPKIAQKLISEEVDKKNK